MIFMHSFFRLLDIFLIIFIYYAKKQQFNDIIQKFEDFKKKMYALKVLHNKIKTEFFN